MHGSPLGAKLVSQARASELAPRVNASIKHTQEGASEGQPVVMQSDMGRKKKRERIDLCVNVFKHVLFFLDCVTACSLHICVHSVQMYMYICMHGQPAPI